MRDVTRIRTIMTLITEIWVVYPDLRFNQLIHHLQTEYDNGAYIKKAYVVEVGWGGVDVSYPDLFNVEDDKFEKFLIEYLHGILKG